MKNLLSRIFEELSGTPSWLIEWNANAGARDAEIAAKANQQVEAWATQERIGRQNAVQLREQQAAETQAANEQRSALLACMADDVKVVRTLLEEKKEWDLRPSTTEQTRHLW